jgi:hypothetical protein
MLGLPAAVRAPDRGSADAYQAAAAGPVLTNTVLTNTVLANLS